jgi:hypothetical protein
LILVHEGHEGTRSSEEEIDPQIAQIARIKKAEERGLEVGAADFAFHVLRFAFLLETETENAKCKMVEGRRFAYRYHRPPGHFPFASALGFPICEICAICGSTLLSSLRALRVLRGPNIFLFFDCNPIDRFENATSFANRPEVVR